VTVFVFGRDCFTLLLTVGPFGIYSCTVDGQSSIKLLMGLVALVFLYCNFLSGYLSPFYLYANFAELHWLYLACMLFCELRIYSVTCGTKNSQLSLQWILGCLGAETVCCMGRW